MIAVGVQALAKFLTGLEEGHELVLDKNRVAGARIAPLPSGAVLHSERAETTQLHAIATGKRTGDLIEHDIDNPLDVAMKEMRIGSRHPLNQFRFDHYTRPTGLQPLVAASPRPPLIGCRVPNRDQTVKLQGRRNLAQQSGDPTARQAQNRGARVHEPAEEAG